MIMYLLGSLALYHTLFDKRLLRHPRFLANQIKLEINQGISAIPTITLLTVPFFIAEIRGWSKLYDFTSESPFWGYTLLQYPLFICFTDSGIYWIHRGLHHPLVYRWLHKPHHKWAVPTPFASYAFHPLDGWSQSLPYHIFPMIFPLQKIAYLGLFVFVTMWTVLIRECYVCGYILFEAMDRKTRRNSMLILTFFRRCRIPTHVGDYQRSLLPHDASSLLQLQLRPIYNCLGSSRRDLSQAQGRCFHGSESKRWENRQQR